MTRERKAADIAALFKGFSGSKRRYPAKTDAKGV